MTPFIKNDLTTTETILIVTGLLFLASVLYVASGGSLALNFIAKGFYIVGVLLLMAKT